MMSVMEYLMIVVSVICFAAALYSATITAGAYRDLYRVEVAYGARHRHLMTVVKGLYATAIWATMGALIGIVVIMRRF